MIDLLEYSSHTDILMLGKFRDTVKFIISFFDLCNVVVDQPFHRATPDPTTRRASRAGGTV